MRHRLWLLTWLGVVCASGLARAADEPRDEDWLPQPPERPVSIHEWESRLHADLPDPPPGEIVPRPLPPGRPRALERVVYGYYPYWLHDLDSLRWSALTHLAWFSLGLSSSGQVTGNRHGWPDTLTVDAAHAHGVRVDLCFTLFDAAGIRTLVNTPANRDAAIRTMVDEMQAGSADGISVDLEGVPADAREGFTALICGLRQEFARRGLADKQISIAGPAVDWSRAFDLPALLDCADYYFIMGYDYFWSGSSRAGPSGILRTTADWRPYAGYSELRSVAYYTSLVPPERRAQIILGVPYYGREWTTNSGDMAATTLANVGSVTYAAAQAALAAGRERRWHAGIRNPWYRWQDAGVWHQVYYDDRESLAAKWALVNDQDLGGGGMWALNHDRGHSVLWDLLEEAFGRAAPTPPGHRLNPLPIESFPFHDARDTSEGPSNYFNFYACRPDLAEWGREWVYRLDLCQPGRLTALVPDLPAADPDLHLLSAPREDACLARAHARLEADLQPGRYWLVVDTYVDNAVELEGPYTLDVDFAPQAGSQPCGPGQTCIEGVCTGGDEEPSHEEEPTAEEQPPADDGGFEADGGPDGQADAGEDGSAGDSSDPDEPPPPSGGCGCGGAGAAGSGTWLGLLFLALCTQRGRRVNG
jgi:hypothetical protein